MRVRAGESEVHAGGCIAAYIFTDERDRVLTVLLHAPPLILLLPHLTLSW